MAEGKRNNTSYIELYAHTGTHIDTPWHFNDAGKKILDFSIEDFIFHRVALLDIPKQPWETIEKSDLTLFEDVIRSSEAVLIRTGFGVYRVKDPELYFRANPGFSTEAAHYLTSFSGLRCVGIDMNSVENLERKRPLNYPVHHAFLDRLEPMILIEDIDYSCLEDHPVPVKIQRLFAFPLRMEELEGSPVTLVAEMDE